MTAPGELRVEIELRRADIDPLGVVRAASYHSMLGEARTVLLERLRLRRHGEFVNAHVELDHVRGLTLEDGRARITLAIGTIGRSSFEILHDIVAPGGTLAATGRTVLVAWDAHARRSRPLDDDDRRALARAKPDSPIRRPT